MNVRWLTSSLIAVAIAGIALGQEPALPVVGGAWVAQGPGPALNGQTEGLTDNPVAGAVNAVVAHPTNANILWIAAVNGGIWKTTNATSASPTWVAQGDALRSLSFGALARDPTDATSNTLVGGYARSSSFGRRGGPRGGIVRTTNGGTSWTDLGQSTLNGRNIRAVIARGSTIVVAVDTADSFVCPGIGIYRSTDTGATFNLVSGAGGSGLPFGRAFDVVGDPSNNAILYTVIRDAPACGGGLNGVYKSVNTGATWTKVSNATMDALMPDDGTFGNARIAVGSSGQIYVGIINLGQLAGLFRSGTGGSSWTQLDTPVTTEAGTPIGIHPDEEEPGSQGGIHFSIAADPVDANIVYVGGDRQPSPFPNSLGAVNFSGRLFRVNAAAAAGSQATSLTHCSSATAACNNTVSTNNNSSPHADSRFIVFDAAGNLIEADDGGLYRRTNPRTTGDWFSVVGNMRVTEMHSLAYDTVSNMIFGGCQDTGTSEQMTVNATIWEQVTQGDGGIVAVDDFSLPASSRRYTSFQFLGGLMRRTVDNTGVTTAESFPDLFVTSGAAFEPQFYTPIGINELDSARMIFAGFNDIYESFDRGDTIEGLGLDLAVTAMAYGGRSGGVDHPDVLYAISGSSVYLRTAGGGALLPTNPVPGGAILRGIAIDPNDWQKVYVINAIGQVFSSTNSGGNWTNITGNLGNGTTDLQSILFIPGTTNALAVGGHNGVFRMAIGNAGVWNQFGSGLSNAVVWDMDHDVVDDTLVAAALGRGTWKLAPAGNLGPLPTLSINDVTVAEGNAGVTNATFTVTLTPASEQAVTVNYATANGTAGHGSFTASDTSEIVINEGGNATPYPSTISVAGAAGTISKLTVTLNGFSHNYTGDVDMLLVGPGGQSVILMSDVASGSISTDLTLTFDDDAPLPTDAGLSSGSYHPADLQDGFGGPDAYGPPAPAPPYGTALSVFNGTSPNGVWSLYIFDDFPEDGGVISGGWTLHVSSSGGDYNGASGLLTFTPGATTRQVTVQVNGDTAAEANETFFVNLSGAVGASLADAQGVGTITNDDGGSTPTNVVATATAATNVNITWTGVAGAASYRVYRRDAAGTWTLVGSPTASPFNDGSVVANSAYLYKVRSFAGSESGDSNIDLATTVIFTDPTVTANVTRVKTVHFQQLLTAVNAVRTLAALSGIAFTAPVPAAAVTLRRQHVLDLRAGLNAARTPLGLAALSYTDPSITAGSTRVKRAHIVELRNGVQ